MDEYNSKVLLFGEHIVNLGANALAIPFSKYTCSLTFDENEKYVIEASVEILKKTYVYIKNHVLLAQSFNLAAFKNDIDNGLRINLSIPFGYGLGSSGAYVSAIYAQYAIEKLTKVSDLQKILGEVESVFHGKSSGLDPLVSYLNQPILIEKGVSRTIDPLNDLQRDLSIFLLNTGVSRSTAPLVHKFLEKTNADKSFKSFVQEQIVPLNNNIIDEIVNRNTELTIQKIKMLSELQLKHFKFLIPEDFIKVWEQGLSEDAYYIKICGAGGGGMMLGFQNKAQVKPAKLNPIFLD